MHLCFEGHHRVGILEHRFCWLQNKFCENVLLYHDCSFQLRAEYLNKFLVRVQQFQFWKKIELQRRHFLLHILSISHPKSLMSIFLGPGLHLRDALMFCVPYNSFILLLYSLCTNAIQYFGGYLGYFLEDGSSNGRVLIQVVLILLLMIFKSIACNRDVGIG